MKHYKRMHSIPKRRRHHSGPPNIKLEKGHAALLKQRRMFVHKNPYAPGAHGSHAANADNIKIVSPGPGFNPPRQGWFHEKGSVPRRQAPNYTRRKRRRTKRRGGPRPPTRGGGALLTRGTTPAARNKSGTAGKPCYNTRL